MSMFQRATKREAKLRMAIMGPSGSGKTYTALAIATALGGNVAVVDTENGSASKYADLFAFDVAEMHAPFSVDKYIRILTDAQEAGYATVILDSVSHAWQGTGGILDYVDDVAKRMKTQNTFAAWKEGTPLYNQLVNAIVESNINVIATMRSKTEYSLDKDDRGRTQVNKVGMAPIQRDGFEYEFDIVFDMTIDNRAIITKSRCPALTGRAFEKPGKEVAGIIGEWLSGEPAERVEVPQLADVDPVSFADPGPPSTNGNGTAPVAEDDNPFDDTKDYRGGLLAELNKTFPPAEKDDARHWLIKAYTTKTTPDNVRESSNDLTPEECKTIADAVRADRSKYQRLWKEHAAQVAEAA